MPDSDLTVREVRARCQRSLWGHADHGWLGAVTFNNRPLVHGDGAAVSGEPVLTITGAERAEVLVFNLA